MKINELDTRFRGYGDLSSVSLDAGSDRAPRMDGVVWPSWSILLAGVALWLLMHPYWGIWHDARLYAVMALHHLRPEAYARDPWFVFGTQDGLSLFTPLFARFIAWLGLGEAARLVALLGGLAYALACWALVRATRLERYAPLAFLLLMSIPLSYCPNDWHITRLAETFPTPRPFAVAASLAALGFQLRGRNFLAWGSFCLALLLHPLMAIGAVAIGLGARLPERLTILAVVLVPALVIALIYAGIPPLQAMDSHWFDLVAQTAMIVVMPGQYYDHDMIMLAAALLLLAAQFGEARLRRYYALAVIVGFLGLVATLLASHVYPSVLILQVQPWRALWLTLVFAIIAFCDLASRWRDATQIGRAGLLLAATALLWVAQGGGYVLLAAAIALHLGRTSFVPRLAALPGIWPYRFGALVFLASAIAMLPGLWLEFSIRGVAETAWSSLPDGLRGIIATGGFGLIALLVWLAVLRLPVRAGLLLALLACGAALVTWDQREDFVRTQEGRYRPPGYADAGPVYFSRHIRPGDVVYWPNSPERVWFELSTASYAGSVQAVGIVFSRRHALEIERRLRRTAWAGGMTAAIPYRDEAARQAIALRLHAITTPDNLHAVATVQGGITPLSRKGLAYLCDDVALDWVIDTADFAELAVAHEVISVVKRGRTTNVEHALYDCRKLRNSVRR